MESNIVRPYKIAVPETSLELLRKKLELATFPEQVDFSDVGAYGASRSAIKRLAKYWQNGFDWRAQEATLNKLPHFTTTVTVGGFGDLDMHFIHQRGGKDSIPLLFSHGCLYCIYQQVNFMLIMDRAGKLPGGGQDTALIDKPQRWPIFPCCRSFIA